MLLMFPVGVANLTWMAVLTALMIYEKTGRLGEWVSRYAGASFLLMAVVVGLTKSGFQGVCAGGVIALASGRFNRTMCRSRGRYVSMTYRGDNAKLESRPRRGR